MPILTMERDVRLKEEIQELEERLHNIKNTKYFRVPDDVKMRIRKYIKYYLGIKLKYRKHKKYDR